MQKIGELSKTGYSIKQLTELRNNLTKKGFACELVDLSKDWKGNQKVDEAQVLIIRQGLQKILGVDSTKSLMQEHDKLDMDKKARMRGKVVNKNARWNLCFAEFD